jgi:hypothetical protein
MEDKLFDFVDGAFYVNLDHRTDRRELIEAHFKSIGIQKYVERARAVYPFELMGYATGDKEKYYGNCLATTCCFVTQTSIIEHAKNQGWETVLIFEDDAEFINTPDFNTFDEIHKGLEQLKKIPDWEILYLGADPDPRDKQKSFDWVSQNLIKLNEANGAHALLYHRRMFDKMLADAKNVVSRRQVMGADDYLSYHVAQKYILNPIAVVQRAELKSDISNSINPLKPEWWLDRCKTKFTGNLNKLF